MTTVEKIKQLGIVGAGGAGFPTYIKLSSKAEIFIVNAAECEPLLHKDKELLRNGIGPFVKGLKICVNRVAARRCIIGIKAKYGDLIAHLQQHLPAEFEIIGLKDFYPVGDEVTLIYETTSRIVPPGALPLSQNVVVSNVETIYNIGSGVPLTSKYISIGGDVKRPITVKVPIGIPFWEVLSLAQPIPDTYAVIVGGPMMGKLAQTLDQPVTKTTGGLLVFPTDHPLIRRYRTAAEIRQVNRIGKSACDQCAICSELCPRHLLGHPIEPHQAMRQLFFLDPNAPSAPIAPHTLFCCECNLCSMVSCPEGLYPAQRCMLGRRQAMAAKTTWQGSVPDKAHPLIDYRRTPVKKLMARLDLLRFANTGPLTAVDLKPKQLSVRLDQHIGAPAIALVDTGAEVKKGQKIATVGDKLGAEIHAPLDGRVGAVNDQVIVIETV